MQLLATQYNRSCMQPFDFVLFGLGTNCKINSQTNLSKSTSSGSLPSSSSRKDKARSMEGRAEESGGTNVEKVVGGSSSVSLKTEKETRLGFSEL